MKKYRIFLVDDDEDDLALLNDVFAESDCAGEIHLLLSVEELLAAFNNSRTALPDLVVLDHQAPGTKGGEAVAILRADSRFDKTALAVYSTHITLSKQQELLQKGADACFSKGTSMQQIKQHVKIFCEVTAKRKGDEGG